MRTAGRRLARLMMVLVPVLAPRGEAAAQPSVPELLARGAAAAAAGSYEACIEAYGAALALEHDAATAGELGLCEEKLAHNVEAYDHLWYALEREVPAAPAPVRARWERFQQGLIRLINRVARVTLFVSPQDAEVLLDGRSLGTQMSGRTLVVLPGEHTWIARAPGRPDRSTTATARGGDVPHVFLVLDEPEPPPAPPRAATSAAPPRAAATPACTTCEPPRQPCSAAGGYPMPVDVCRAIRLLSRGMDPTLGLVAGGLLSLGFTADVGPGFFLGGEAHWRRQEDWGFQVGAEARFFLPTNAGSLLGQRLDVTALELALVPCARYKWVFGCAFLTPGMTLAGGQLLDTPEGGGFGHPTFLFGVGPRLGVDIPVVERFGVRAFADLRINPLQETSNYIVNGAFTVWEEPRVSGSVGLGISFR